MILLLDTSTPVCKLSLVNDGRQFDYEWQADRQLARGLLSYIRDTVVAHGSRIDLLEGMVIMRGPGSFTGLRIGCTVLNTIAQFSAVPLVGTTGERWQAEGQTLLAKGENHRLVIPDYGRPARITKPRK